MIEDIKLVSFSNQINSQLKKVMHFTFNQHVSIIYDQLLRHKPIFRQPNNSPKARLPIISKVAKLIQNARLEPYSMAA